MASLSPEYILDDIENSEDLEEEKITALRLSLYSTAGGSTNPLQMADKKDAKKWPVLFERLVNSWN